MKGTPMKLLDTTFLIHYWGGVDGVAEYLEANEESEFVTTSLNIKLSFAR